MSVSQFHLRRTVHRISPETTMKVREKNNKQIYLQNVEPPKKNIYDCLTFSLLGGGIFNPTSPNLVLANVN